MKKTTLLKQLIISRDLEFLLEAHNGISARIVEEAGFKGIWGSGLTISASLGLRDSNEASWTQILEVVEFMSDATNIPILLDGDTGYGNFNNMRRLVKKLEQRGIAGVCVEDKIFPKTNSFLRGEAQPLAGIDEFCGKIKAGKDSQSDEDFVIVARVEAFIAGWGLREALKRADAYRKAGADAILIHSKLSQPTEVFEFIREWENRAPVVIVPTKYYSTPTESFREHKVSVVIWANHLMRGSIRSIQSIARQIYEEQNLHNVEDTIVPVSEIFRLQRDSELQEAEKLYLNKQDKSYGAIILAAWQGKPLGQITESIPKTMIEIGGTSILQKTVDRLKEFNINNVTVVAGYRKDKIKVEGINLLENSEYKNTGQMVSLAMGIESAEGKLVVLFGDVLFKKYIMQLLLDDPMDIVLVVDSKIIAHQKTHKSDYVYANLPDEKTTIDKEIFLKKMVYKEPCDDFNGEWIGMVKFSEKGTAIVKEFIEEFKDEQEFHKMQIRDMLNYFVENGVKVKIQYISGHWIDIDTVYDLSRATNF